MSTFKLNYEAEPTASKFHASPAFVRAIMGPIGSGKSVALFQEIFRNGLEQQPGPDGVRRTRWAVIRNTYPELKSTSIKTFEDWFGPIAFIKYDSPIVATIKFKGFHQEILFLSLDKPQDVKKLLSLELTGAAFNECREIALTHVEMATGRVGRYPPKKDGGPTRSCVIMDTNPPDDDHWFFELFEVKKPEGYALFKQPPALLKVKTPTGVMYVPNPEAEAVKHQPLGFEYWERQIPGKKEEWIKVYVEGKYGSSMDGRPCYPSYNDTLHCSDEQLEVYKGIPLLLGWDYGRTPACIIGQVSPKGQLRIYEEIAVEADGEGMGIRKFTRDVVKPYLTANYPGFDVIYSTGDPSGVTRGQNEDSIFDIQAQEGIPTNPATTNDVEMRLDNVDYFLTILNDGQPGFLLDPRCKILRKGFLGGYQFERMQVSGEARYRDKPKKNRYSHPHDALQYLADYARNGVVKAGSRAKARPIVSTGAPNAMGWT